MSKDNVQVNNQVQKKYSYTAPGVNLSFTLNQDEPESMRNFIKVLERATKDVQEDLEEYEV